MDVFGNVIGGELRLARATARPRYRVKPDLPPSAKR
jgi:hypothetical protein